MKSEGMENRTSGTSVGANRTLSEDIHLLRGLLEQVIVDQEGQEVFHKVERLLHAAKAIREGGGSDGYDSLRRITVKLPMATITRVLRAFTVYFQLVNEAEQQEIARVNRQRELEAARRPRAESIAEALDQLRRSGMTSQQLQQLLDSLAIQPVLTAHPTEVKRRSVLEKLRDISSRLFELHLQELLPSESEAAISSIHSLIISLWQTDEVRPVPIGVLDEVRNGLFYFDKTVFRLVPRLHEDLKEMLHRYYPESTFHLPALLRFGSWIGGDRDGNPKVTPEVPCRRSGSKRRWRSETTFWRFRACVTS